MFAESRACGRKKEMRREAGGEATGAEPSQSTKVQCSRRWLGSRHVYIRITRMGGGPEGSGRKEEEYTPLKVRRPEGVRGIEIVLCILIE